VVRAASEGALKDPAQVRLTWRTLTLNLARTPTRALTITFTLSESKPDPNPKPNPNRNPSEHVLQAHVFVRLLSTRTLMALHMCASLPRTLLRSALVVTG